MELGEYVAKYRKEAGITIDDLASRSGVPKGTINKIIAGTTKSPTLENVRSIATALGKTLNDFIGDYSNANEKAPSALPEEALQVAKDYHHLDKWGKRVVRSVISDEQARINEEQGNTANTEPPAKLIYIKRNDLKASAGDGFLLDEESTEDFAVLYNDLTRKADFCVEVQGDSMEPKLHDGDWILVRQQPSVEVGEIGLFMVDGKGYVKQQGEDRLISLNPDYDDVFPTEFIDVRCAGLVLGVLDPDWIVEE